MPETWAADSDGFDINGLNLLAAVADEEVNHMDLANMRLDGSQRRSDTCDGRN